VLKFDGYLCKRLHAASQHRSVVLFRVGSVKAAYDRISNYIRKFGNVRIKHMVLGGHGDQNSLDWGDDDDDDNDDDDDDGDDHLGLRVYRDPAKRAIDLVTLDFFGLISDFFVRADENPTLFLDSCLSGKSLHYDGRHGKLNLAQFVAQLLFKSNVKVFASRACFENKDVEFLNGENFDAIIRNASGKDAMIKLYLGDGELRDWGFHVNLFCKEKLLCDAPKANKDITGCRDYCKAEAVCKAIVWYPHGNCKRKKRPCNRKCCISKDCDNTAESNRYAMIFMKPEPKHEQDNGAAIQGFPKPIHATPLLAG